MTGPADPGGRITEPADPGRPTTGPRDPGASAERTRLAWRRTGLSATAVALLMLRPAFAPDARLATFLIAGLAMAGWVALVALAYRRARGLNAWPPQPGRRTVTWYAVLTIGLAGLGAVLVML
ncbi:DUF202 domain-containing protein [Actinoplanes sp. N902-109]|uniref:DUF202 domain-containing protein n=1 Tax=Actinoplanes sp. (strain N902-109) TaxID=649831 RepID=UPI0003295511|nr:DUF202 domain-containing protein [Actinoplanes sp. N902-109]AGL20517.1 hypothetical protein L083_7007 [Actinoplanes sp. N902-109]